jgi:AbrB family looped-hinge helix DNA binding protein
MTVKVSSKFQVVIPREIREGFHIEPGDSFEVVSYDNRIELLPVRDIRTMRGVLEGMDAGVDREGDRL